MEAISATMTPPVHSAGRTQAFNELKSDDFLKLLITQLTSQDPLEPTDNQALLEQISSIRNIELSTTLTDSLRQLTGEQRFASASSLIGQFVTGVPNEEGAAISGVVNGVRFDGNGRPMLQLGNGALLPLEDVAAVEPPVRAAESLIGQSVTGLDRTDPLNIKPVEGGVTGVRIDEKGEVVLELDTGGKLQFRDVIAAAPTE